MVQATRIELRVAQRQVLGKKVKQLRRQGLIPANVFGRHVESVAIQVPTEDLLHVLQRAGRNEIVYLRLGPDGPGRPTFIRHVQRHPVRDDILHVDFQQISLTERVRLEVPIVLVGKAPAVDTYGGTLLHSLDYITVEGLPTDIPSQVEVDVSSLDSIGAYIHVSDMPVPPELTVLTDPQLVVATVAPPKVEEVAVPEEETVAPAEEAAPAAEGEEAEEG